MLKYLIGVGALVVAAAVGYVLLLPAADPQAPASDPAPSAANPPVSETPAPETVVAQDEQPAIPDEEAVLEEMAADARESLPAAVTDTLTLTDVLFLPRMRIMEYTHLSSVADAPAAANDMRALIEARTEQICLDRREMLEMGVTLRHSFEDRDGTLVQRVYLLPEDCRPFY